METPSFSRRKRAPALLALACLATLAALLVSCGADDEAGPASDGIERPTMSFVNAVYTLGRPEFSPIVMKAGVLELYNDRNQALLKGVEFEQKDEEGRLVMEGSCEEAEVDTKSYDARLKGKVLISLPQEKLSIDASDVVWNHADQRISTDKEVFLLYDSKSGLRGRGFSCDFKTSKCEFDEITEGRLAP